MNLHHAAEFSRNTRVRGRGGGGLVYPFANTTTSRQRGASDDTQGRKPEDATQDEMLVIQARRALVLVSRTFEIGHEGGAGRVPILSHRKCLQSCSAKVHSRTNLSTYSLQ